MHPPLKGLSVTRKAYDGAIEGPKGLEPEFRAALDGFMRRVFGPRLEPKRIHGRPLTAPELLEYVKTYVALFQNGNKFPEVARALRICNPSPSRLRCIAPLPFSLLSSSLPLLSPSPSLF